VVNEATYLKIDLTFSVANSHLLEIESRILKYYYDLKPLLLLILTKVIGFSDQANLNSYDRKFKVYSKVEILI
jgi:hypothetical protein